MIYDVTTHWNSSLSVSWLHSNLQIGGSNSGVATKRIRYFWYSHYQVALHRITTLYSAVNENLTYWTVIEHPVPSVE